MQERITKKTRMFLTMGLLTLALINAFWMLSVKSLDSHECFVSVTAREMVQDGHWIVPTLNGHIRLNKTPLPYWLVAGFAKITGKVDEFTARFPSAVFAVMSAVVILFFVNKWLDFRTAVVSTAVWITSHCYIRSSHSARPDMGLVFFVLVCFLSFYSVLIAENRKQQIIYSVIFWISFALGNLAKGPAPVAFVLIPIFVYMAANKAWKVLPKMLPIAGIVIFFIIVLPWPLYIAHKLNWDLMLWKREYIDRLYGEYAPGDYPIYYYFGIIFKFITPWVIFLPIALIAPFNKKFNGRRGVIKFLWILFVAGFAFLTIDVGKRQHYIMPFMPLLSILIGIVLEDMVFRQTAYPFKFAKDILKIHCIVIIIGIISASIYMAIAKPVLLGRVLLLSAFTITVIWIVILLFYKKRSGAGMTSVFIGIVVWTMMVVSEFGFIRDVDRGARDFACKVAQIVPATDNLVCYGHVSSRFVQYFGKVVPEEQDKSKLLILYEQGNWIIATSDYLGDLTEDNRFRKIYFRQRQVNQKEDTGGILFHKSAPTDQVDAITDFNRFTSGKSG